MTVSRITDPGAPGPKSVSSLSVMLPDPVKDAGAPAAMGVAELSYCMLTLDWELSSSIVVMLAGRGFFPVWVPPLVIPDCAIDRSLVHIIVWVRSAVGEPEGIVSTLIGRPACQSPLGEKVVFS